MSALEGLLVFPLLLIVVAAMMAYAYFSGKSRTTEAERRREIANRNEKQQP